MDNNNSAGGNIAIDPNQLAPQGSTPLAPQSPATTLNHLVDITPGAAEVPPMAPPSSHVDDAILPESKVLDITPNPLSDFDKIPATPTATPAAPAKEEPKVEPVIDITPAASTQIPSPVPTPIVSEPIASPAVPPMGTLPPLPSTPLDSAVLPTPPVESLTPPAPEQPVAPAIPAPMAPVTPPAASPFAEDPNLVKTIS